MRSTTVLISVALAAGAAPAAGQTIRVYADSACTSCQVQIPYPGGAVFYTVLHPGPANSASFVHFRIVGLPPGWTTITQPLRTTVFDDLYGDPFGDGVWYGFPCRTGACIPLFRTLVLPDAPQSDVALSVTHSPSDCGIPFPWDCRPLIVWSCDQTGAQLAEDRAGVINGSQDCTVAVQPVTWGQLRLRYR